MCVQDGYKPQLVLNKNVLPTNQATSKPLPDWHYFGHLNRTLLECIIFTVFFLILLKKMIRLDGIFKLLMTVYISFVGKKKETQNLRARIFLTLLLIPILMDGVFLVVSRSPTFHWLPVTILRWAGTPDESSEKFVPRKGLVPEAGTQQEFR